jgi:hypothetical protein
MRCSFLLAFGRNRAVTNEDSQAQLTTRIGGSASSSGFQPPYVPMAYRAGIS